MSDFEQNGEEDNNQVEMKLDKVLAHMVQRINLKPARETIDEREDEYSEMDIRRQMRYAMADAFDEGYLGGLRDIVNLVKQMDIDVLVSDDIAAQINAGE